MKHKRRLKSLEVRRAVNGVTIRHETEPGKSTAKNGPSEYEPPQEHAFNDHAAAHAHVTKHLAQMFGNDEESGEDPAEERGESAAKERSEEDKEGRKDDVAAFRRLRKKGHLS